MTIPQLGKTHPALLATDDQATIAQKVREQLARLRDSLDTHIANEKETGVADKPSFCPNATVSIPCVYVDEASAKNVHPNIAYGLVVALNSLQDYGLFLVDVFEWESADFTDENDIPPFPQHELGLVFRVKVGAAEYQDNYRRGDADRLIEAKQKFDAGELRTNGGSGLPPELARLLAAAHGRGR